LKGKRAEFPALKDVELKDHLTPLMEAVPTAPPDCIATNMANVWPDTLPYFVDMLFLDDEDMTEGEAADHPIATCLAKAAEADQHAIPVTGTARSPAYQSALRTIVDEQQNGFAIRLVPQDFEDEDQLIEAIDSLVEYVDIDKDAIDILVDGDTVAGLPAATVSQLHRARIDVLPYADEWRTITAIAGAFPMGLAPLTSGAWNTPPRVDWLGWHAIVRRPRNLTRLPAYGDYTIAHPNLPPTGRATILAQLRYATPDTFLVWKGHNVFKHAAGFGQFLQICQSMVARREYCGLNFSAGDAEIHEKATNGGSPGNAERWRRIGTNHHIEMVLDQLASLP
jgi:hypothetical protein